MKNKSLKSILIFLICIQISSTFISCNRNSNDDDTIDENLYRVTCIIPHKNDRAYWSVIEEGIIDGAKDKNIDVKIIYPSLNYDTTQMLKLLKIAIASKVDCIIISGVEDQRYYETINKAIESGIFVILVDTDMKELTNITYVGSNNKDAGILYAENISRITNGAANIGIISGDTVFYNLKNRLEGIQSVISKEKNMNIVDIKYDKFDYSIVEKIYDEYLNNSKIDTIVCLEGTAGMALNSYVKDTSSKDIFVFDDTPQALAGLKNNIFKGILVQQKYQMGYRVIEEIDSYKKNDNYIPKKIYTDTKFIEASSVK